MALISLYADDAGDDRDDRDDDFYLLSGYVAPVAAWADLTSQWQELLRKFGLEWFHMTDAESRQPHPYRKWTNEQREHRISAFAALVASMPKSFLAYVDIPAWRSITDELKGLGRPEMQLGRVYGYLVAHTMSVAAGVCDSIGAPLSCVDVIIAKPNKTSQHHQGLIRECFGMDGLEEPIWRCTKDWPGLQAADMCAWLTRKRLVHENQTGSAFPDYPRHQGILRPNHLDVPIEQEKIDALLNVIRASRDDVGRS